MTHRLTLRIYRYKPGARPRYDTFAVAMPGEANVLDALERAWADDDRSLAFRHACHHASCGSCGLRIDGIEKLPCVTPVTDYPDGATVTLEPLRNFDVIADLVVDVSPLFGRMQAVGAPIMRPAEPLEHSQGLPEGVEDLERFENCLECGLCVSACPAMAADRHYLGPAALAGAERALVQSQNARLRSLLYFLDDDHGLWRCHSAFECTEVCPSNVQPAEAIMRLKRAAAGEKVRTLFRRWG